jgi:SAM-dependent methyltransferase
VFGAQDIHDRGHPFPPASGFFIGRGLDYLAVDAPGEAEARDFVIGRDLNYPVDVGTFDIVTNFGTSEHVFNQAAIFQSIHDASSEYMVHALPGAMRDHGLFGYSNKFFAELARANNYEIVAYGDVIDADTERMVAVCFRKANNDPFAFPYDYGFSRGAV